MSDKRHWLGIDPGKSGALAVITSDGKARALPMPLLGGTFVDVNAIIEFGKEDGEMPTGTAFGADPRHARLRAEIHVHVRSGLRSDNRRAAHDPVALGLGHRGNAGAGRSYGNPARTWARN